MPSTKKVLEALKPRNVFAALARRRSAGKHRPANARQEQAKDLVQRLREAGM